MNRLKNMVVVTDPALLAIAAAIVMAGGLIGTGLAQQGIGAAGMGIIAKSRKNSGRFYFLCDTRNALDNRLRAWAYSATSDNLICQRLTY
jgi:hypothetical protein